MWAVRWYVRSGKFGYGRADPKELNVETFQKPLPQILD